MSDLSLEEVAAGLPQAAPPVDLSLEDVAGQGERPRKPKKPPMSDSDKARSSLVTGAARVAALPWDTLAGVANLPSMAMRGMGWLADTMGLPEKGATARQAAENLAPTSLNKALHPFTSEGGLEEVRRKVPGFAEKYEAETMPGKFGQAITERGPSYAVSGAAFGIPNRLNAATAVGAPAAGEAAYNVAGGGEGGETARVIAEIGTSTLLPPAAWAGKTIARERALRTHEPHTNLNMGDAAFERAAPYVAEMFGEQLTPQTRQIIIDAIENPTRASEAMLAARPALAARVNQVKEAIRNQAAARTSAAEQTHIGNVQQTNANQMARDLAAQQAEQQAGVVESQLRATVRPSEEIGAALQGEVSNARQGMSQRLEPLYGSGWEKESVSLAGRSGMADAITDSLMNASALRDTKIIPQSFLRQQLQKIVGETASGLPYLRSMPAEVAVQIRREIDDAVSKYTHVFGDTAGNLRRESLTGLRKAINDALDDAAKTNPQIAALRQADREYAQFQAPLGSGLTGKTIAPGEMTSASGAGMKQAPELAGETLLPKGDAGASGARELMKIHAAQQQAGVTSGITPLVEERIQSLILSNTKKGDLAGGIEKVLDSYGPFMREYDRLFGKTTFADLQAELAAQRLKQQSATGMRDAATVGERESAAAVAGSEAEKARRIAEVNGISTGRQRAVASGTSAELGSTAVPQDVLHTIMGDAKNARELNSIINLYRKSGQLPQLYQGLLGSFEARIHDMMTGGAGFGGQYSSGELMRQYERALRAAGAPPEIIANLTKTLDDVERLRMTGQISRDHQGNAVRAEKQFLYGALGRNGGLLQMAFAKAMGEHDLAMEIGRLALKDPAVARHILDYKGKVPEKYMRYLLKNPAISALVTSVQPETPMPREED